MILSDFFEKALPILVPILIIGGAVALFIITFVLNRKTKVPEGTIYDLPDKCMKCGNEICKQHNEEKMDEIKKNKIELTPDELIEMIRCEEENNEQKQ